MPISETLPRPIEETLAAQNGGSADVVIAVAADLSRQGRFGEEWLVVTKDRLLVYEPNGGQPTPRDRWLATRFGAAAVHLVAQERWGHIVALQGTEMVAVPMAEAVQIKYVDPNGVKFDIVNAAHARNSWRLEP